MKKLILYIALAVISLIVLVGCTQIFGFNNTNLTAKVTKIEGTKVTVELGEIRQASSSNNHEEDNPPEKPEDEKNNNSENKPPEPPDGSKPPEKAETNTENNESHNEDSSQPKESDSSNPPEPPSGNPGSNESFIPSGEQASYNLNNIEIKVEENGKTSDGSIDDIKVGSLLSLEMAGDTVKAITILQNSGNLPGSGNQVNQGSAANTIDSETKVSGQTYESTEEDQNALRITDAKVELDNVSVKKNSGNSSSTEDGDFYGMNAALLATNKADATIKNSVIESAVQNGNGVFSYGEGTTVNISDSQITTKGDNSGGIQTTGGATTNAQNLNVQTSGNSSAAIRSDRGGGTVRVEGGEYVSNGYNSPAIYSTANIKVKNANLKANNSESLVIEGKNSIELENCTVSGNMSSTKGSSSDINVHNVMIYQSMSGDADIGNSSFKMNGGTLTGSNGDMFYITNTDCTVDLDNVTINQQDKDSNLFTITGNNAKNGWGKAGSNGANANITAKSQTLNGNIVVDTISTLSLSLTNNSNFTGSINVIDNSEGGNKVDNNAVVKIDEGSTWTLTEDCKITSLENKGTINYNGHSITLEDGTVLK